MTHEIYPLGSIVKLKKNPKYLMIIGYLPIDIELRINYDYLGCLYPEGTLSSAEQIGFHHENIEELIYKAPIDEESEKVLQKIKNFYQNNGKQRLQNNLKK